MKLTVQGILDVLEVLTVTYPNYHPEVEKTIKAWSSIFQSFDDVQVKQAVQMYIVSDEKGFAPSAGQIISNIHAITPFFNKHLKYLLNFYILHQTIRKSPSNYNCGKNPL